jgi:hypothetical protein
MNHQIDSEDLPTNLSNNEHFQSVVDRAVNRRGFLFKSGVGGMSEFLCKRFGLQLTEMRSPN